ncbi:MFS general substrate transporter [Marasmius fiardii PR-910]|nr:MFS general substrate transporter [Marasmius fiardii PR-910]
MELRSGKNDDNPDLICHESKTGVKQVDVRAHECSEDLNNNSSSNENSNDAAAEYFPDGGLRAWLCVFGVRFLITDTQFGIFQEYYRVNTLKDRPIQDISWIGSLQLCFNLLTGCISGPLFDAGYFKHLIAGGGILYFFTLFMTSISTEYYQFILAQGIGVGLSAGMLFTPSLSVLAHHFKRHRSAVFGIFAGGASVGGAVLPIAVQRLLNQVGFPWTIRIMAFIILFCVATGFVCCSPRLQPRRGSRVLDFRVFRDVSYTFLVFGAGLVSLGLYVPLTYGVTYAVQNGMSSRLAFYSLSILNGCSLFGRTLPLFIAQRVGPLNVLIVACTFASIMLFVFTTAKSNVGILVYDGFFGVFSGTYVSGLPAACSSLTRDPKETGLRLGMMYFVTSFFWLASSPIQGVLIRMHGEFWPAAVFGGSCVALGVCCMLIVRYLTARVKGTPLV